MKFSPAFVDAHKRLAPAIPIKRFASIVNPTSIGMSSTQDFYAPVRFSVQASGKPNDATGIIRLDVAVQKNPDWLRDMKEQLTSTLGLETIELRTVTGMPLEMVPVEQLHNVGKLQVYDALQDAPIRLASLPQVPAEYRVTKVVELKQWAHKLSQGKMPEVLASVLKGKDVHEVEAALLSNGAMMKAIQSELSKNGDWAEFVRLHQSSSTKTPKPVEANQLLEKVSRQILAYVNNFIGAASQQVKEHIVAEQFKNIHQKGDAFRPILSSIGMGTSRQKENPKLYQTLIEDALSVPMLQKSLVSSVYNFSPTVVSKERNKLVAASRPLMKRIASNHHPWYAHIHHTLLPLKGSYPSDYLVKHTKQDMSAKAPYIGDVNQTYEAYHRFSGVSNAPPPCRIKGGILLDPISCHMQKKKAKKQEEQVDSRIGIEMPKLIPIESNFSQGGMPKLIPIESNFSQGAMPKLIPIGCHGKCEGEECEKVESALPRLIPIGSDLTGGMPKLIPIGSDLTGGMPKLIPIEGHYPHDKKKHHGKKHHYRSDSGSSSGSDSDDVRAAIGSSLYDAIGRADEEDVDASMQHTEADFAHLPDVNDVFK